VADPFWTRRRFLRGLAGGLGALGLGGLDALSRAAAAIKLPKPRHSGIDHIIAVMMENRSYDHMLGWLPGSDGRQAGLQYTDAAGVAHETFPLAPDYQGCGHPDPDHSYEGGRIEYNGGACDGWLRAGENDLYAIGYYTQSDLPFLAAAAPYWTTCDRYFSSIMSSTFPNRMYSHAAQTDRIDNSAALSTLPTIWDRLADAGVPARYYFSDVPFLALWGLKYRSISHSFATFLEDCANGTLPAVSFVEPRFIDEESGTSGDDHPHADIRNGQAFLNTVYTAVTRGPRWKRTLLVINYDEWGGFFDHVPPDAAPIPPADQVVGNADGLRGFRVPCLIISPVARRRFVARTVFDHTSVLRLIEWRWNLDPLTIRDATANNIATALDFEDRKPTAPAFAVPPGPFGEACPTQTAASSAEEAEWLTIRDVARTFGWPGQG
jgi:phospholipase C